LELRIVLPVFKSYYETTGVRVRKIECPFSQECLLPGLSQIEVYQQLTVRAAA
jgi:hypothetical protein